MHASKPSHQDLAAKDKLGRPMRSAELFSGAGGLALGTAKAGFRHEVLVEWNHDACETLRKNKTHQLAGDWRVHEGDIAKFDFATIQPDLDLLAGGPPANRSALVASTRGWTTAEISSLSTLRPCGSCVPGR